MPDTLPNGVKVPKPSETIPANGVEDRRVMGESIDTQLGLRPPIRQAPSTGDLDQVFTPGEMRFGASVIGGWSNVPEELTGPFFLSTHMYPDNSRWGWQEAVMHGQADVRIWRHTTSIGAWGEWLAWGNGGGPPSNIPTNALTLASRDLRVGMFEDAYPLVSTGGLGVVVFRYDHGLTNFKSTLLPLHDQYGIVPYIAMNSRNWGLEQNSGATQAEAKTWNVEWGNHTADHLDKIGITDIYDTILNGRLELESQLGVTIHGFTVPGLAEIPGGDKFDGFGTGSLTGYSNSYAGSLIMSGHAVCSGTVGPVYRPLDGTLPIGTRHWTWESSDWETIKAKIDEAVSTKTALTLMCHPSTMAASAAYWDAGLAEQVISYVRQLIDAGDLADITYYQSHRAMLDPLPTGDVDTGWRQMTNWQYGWTGGEFFMRRQGGYVSYAFKGLDGMNATNSAVIPLATGFSPDAFTGGSQTFWVRPATGDPFWGLARKGFFQLQMGKATNTAAWQVVTLPAEAALPNMDALPGTPRDPSTLDWSGIGPEPLPAPID